MANTIKLKRGTSTPSTSDIVSGEVAVDTWLKSYIFNDSGTVKEIGGGGTGTGETYVKLRGNNTALSDTGRNIQIGYQAGNAFDQGNGDEANENVFIGYGAAYSKLIMMAVYILEL